MSDSNTSPDELFGFEMKDLTPEALRVLARYCDDLESLSEFEWQFKTMSRELYVTDLGANGYLKIALTPFDRFNLFTEEGWEVYHQKKWTACLYLYDHSYKKVSKGSTPTDAYAKLIDICGEFIDGIISLTKSMQ